MRIRIDRQLLRDLGLSSLPDDLQPMFLRHIYETLELRVGIVLANSMSESQLDEFERLVDGDVSFAERVLDTVTPGWQEDEAFLERCHEADESGAPVRLVVIDQAALAWLEDSFPYYREVVRAQYHRLLANILARREAILELGEEDRLGGREAS